MALNYIWAAFILVAFAVALAKYLFLGDGLIFGQLVESVFKNSENGFTISLYMTGVLTFWMGILKVGEKGGAVGLLAKAVEPLLAKIFPELPKGHPAYGHIVMNVAANMLNLDNAATPMGLKAMKELQESNPDKETATNAQIMFLVLNTSGLTIIPVSIMTLRAAQGAANPTDIFLPILLATFFSTLVGLLAVAAYQRINLLDRVVLAYLGLGTAFVGGIFLYFSRLAPDELASASSTLGNFLILAIIAGFVLMALLRRVPVYEAFIEGAKDGFKTAVGIIPYLLAILVAVGLFRESGAMGWLVEAFRWTFAALGLDTSFVEALPTAFMKPLSGSGARGMVAELMAATGPDSFASKVACTIQGSTDTTFYILAVYFGSVGVRKTRHALPAGLLADLAGIVAAIIISYFFFF